MGAETLPGVTTSSRSASGFNRRRAASTPRDYPKYPVQICVGATTMSLLARAGGAPTLGRAAAEFGLADDATTPPAVSGQFELEPEDEHLLVAEASSDGSL